MNAAMSSAFVETACLAPPEAAAHRCLSGGGGILHLALVAGRGRSSGG